jgi:hypothetical protein
MEGSAKENSWMTKKRIRKLRYMHRNAVKRDGGFSGRVAVSTGLTIPTGSGE